MDGYAVYTNNIPSGAFRGFGAPQAQFASEVMAVEMAGKDKGRVDEGWAYYGFGHGTRPASAPNPKASCYNCHIEHAQRDNVFMQFYGLLKDAAPRS